MAKIKQKVESVGVPLKDWGVAINYGIKTGYNDAFIIDEETKNALVAADSKSAEIIRPILRGKDIKKYGCTPSRYLITIPCGFTNSLREKLDSETYIKSTYPAIYGHFMKVHNEYLAKQSKTKSKGLLNRDDMGDYWWELRSCAYMEDFSKQKIIYPNMTKYLPFYYDVEGYYTNQKCFIITGRHLAYLTAFFNSSLFKYCFRENFPELQGGTRELSKIFFDKIPVMEIDNHINQVFEEKILRIQDYLSQGKDTRELEIELDNEIFYLYGLNEEEIKEIGFIEIK